MIRSSNRPIAFPLYGERILRRQREWWSRPPGWWHRPSSLHTVLHRFRERQTTRRPEEPLRAWRCCPAWQRTLIHKANGRLFAEHHGCKPPELFWHGRRLDRLPWEALPEAFAIRRVWGAESKQVYVLHGELELLRGRRLTRSALRSELVRRFGRRSAVPFLVEAFAGEEGEGGPRPALECKCHAFGAEVVAVEVMERGVPAHPCRAAQLIDPDGTPMGSAVTTSPALLELSAPPPYFDDIVAGARRLGQAIGTYMRIDFFASSKGPIFSEFSSAPYAGWEKTAFADRFLGDAWQRLMPDAI